MENPAQDEGGNLATTPSLSSQKPTVPDSSLSETPTISLGRKTPPEVHVSPVDPSSQDEGKHIPPNSSTTSPQQRPWKLSPTASTFRPILDTPLRQLHLASRGLPVPSVLTPFQSTPHNLSSHLGLSRHLIFTPATGKLSVADVQGFVEKLGHLGFQFLGNRHVQASGDSVSAYFTDIRDSCLVYTNAHLFRVDWDVRYVAGMTISDTRHGGDLSSEGQLAVVASITPSSELDDLRAEAIIRQLLHSQAQVFCILEQSSFQSGTYRSTVEYCDVTAAYAAAARLTDAAVEGIKLKAMMHSNEGLVQNSALYATLGSGVDEALLRKDLDESRCTPRTTQPGQLVILSPTGPTGLSPCSRDSPSSQGIQSSHPTYPLSQTPRFPQPPYSLSQEEPSHTQLGTDAGMTGRHSYPARDRSDSPSRHTNTLGHSRLDFRRQNPSRGGRGSYHGVPAHHNHVDIHRIREGTDVRTTIMLRNIPNKVDQAMLKRIIDESTWGKYDFMYLRIDFANDCNVGYAFINFVDPLDIVDFVNARGNQRWNCFKSDKVAEISYATIQGKDCLVQKFRNSSVMLEAPHYRPKLYFTSNGPHPELAGQEEPFPGPDNQSKMKRSCENAEHVGLFTPNAGQHLRDEQRRRRSQYDRGTRLAALEEYDYEAAIQHLYGQQ